MLLFRSYFKVIRVMVVFVFESIRRHTSWTGDWSSDVCSSDLAPLLGPGHAPAVEAFLRRAFETRRGAVMEQETTRAGDTRTFRLTTAPFESADEEVHHAVVLVEDVTRAKRLERQMLLTERLT